MSVRTWVAAVHNFVFSGCSNRFCALQAEAAQLKFLLESAPMMNMERDYFKRSGTKYAYINPKTLLKLVPSATPYYMEFPPSPTRWQFVPLMPEGRVIFSQVPMLCTLKGLVK
jgi:hypothetical protein